MYVKLNNGEVEIFPYSPTDLIRANPNTSFPRTLSDEVLASFDVFPVIKTAPPEYNNITHRLIHTVVQVEGEWTQQWVLEALPPEEADANLISRRSALWEEIKAIRDNKTQTGGYLAAGKWFHSDTFSRTQQIGLVMMGVNIPPGLMWKTMDGTFVEMTPALAGQVFNAAAVQDTSLFAYAENLKQQIDNAEDPSTIDITAGWPATYN